MNGTYANNRNECSSLENTNIAISSNSEINMDVVCGVGSSGSSPPQVNTTRESTPGGSSCGNLPGDTSCFSLEADDPHSTVTASGQGGGGQTALEQGRQSSPTPPLTPDTLITEAMISEEHMLRDSSRLDEKEKVIFHLRNAYCWLIHAAFYCLFLNPPPPPPTPQVVELSHVVEAQRYARLQHLLEKSSIYSKFLLQRMEAQLKAEQVKEKVDAVKDGHPDVAGPGKSQTVQRSSRERRVSTKKTTDGGRGLLQGGGLSEETAGGLPVTGGQMEDAGSPRAAKRSKGVGYSTKLRYKSTAADSSGYKLSDYMDKQVCV